MVVSAGTPPLEVSPAQTSLADSPEVIESISRYLASGERINALLASALTVCLGLIVLVVFAWASGVLPGAIKPF